MSRSFASFVLTWLCSTISASVAAHQEVAPVHKAVDEFLKIQTNGLPGQVSYTIGQLDPKNQLSPCSAFNVSLPPGARAWGRIHVSVRCQAERGWSLFLPVHVQVIADYLVTAAPLVQGQTIVQADLARQSGDLSDLPAGVLTDERQALGRTVAVSIAAGKPLRADLLRQAPVVQQNQTVRVLSRGPGFQVSNEGKALNGATDGQVVQVRLQGGQVVSGIARAGGVVEVGP